MTSPKFLTMSTQCVSINSLSWRYCAKLPWLLWMSWSMIWLVSFIVKFLEISWTIWARATLICADCSCRCRSTGTIALALVGSLLSNWHCMNSSMGDKLRAVWRFEPQLFFLFVRDELRGSSWVINVALSVPHFPELVIPLRPRIPNIGVPLTSIAVRTSLEGIRGKFTLPKMSADFFKGHSKASILSSPATLQVARETLHL